jgi:hypothetical protein
MPGQQKLAWKGGEFMKKPYSTPNLVQYGRMEELTMGNNGCLPDNDNQPNIDTITSNHNNGTTCVVGSAG